MDCVSRWNRFNPFRFVWDPRLAFTGITILGYNPDTGAPGRLECIPVTCRPLWCIPTAAQQTVSLPATLWHAALFRSSLCRGSKASRHPRQAATKSPACVSDRDTSVAHRQVEQARGCVGWHTGQRVLQHGGLHFRLQPDVPGAVKPVVLRAANLA